MQLADFKKMESIRARVDAIVQDRSTAEALKPYYRYLCKRPASNDDYYPAFNQPNVELIDIPQRMNASRKNAADIKMVVDALEVAFERSYISTFVLCTGDSDFTPLVHKLRELNKRVIGVGVEKSTSALLPPA